MSGNYALGTKSFYDPVTKIWSGPKGPLTFGEHETIGKVVLEAFSKDPNHISQICHHNGKKYTNQEMASFSIRIAQHLEELGLKENDVIGICACNSDFVAPLVFGALLEGCVISSLDPSFEKDGIKHIYSMTLPKIMFCDGSNYGRMKEALDELGLNIKIYTLYGHLDGMGEITEFIKETGQENECEVKTSEKSGNDLAVILCSSGTTGLPKGLCLSHSMLLNVHFLPMNEGDVLVSFSTLFWISGVLSLLASTVRGITRVIDARGYSPEVFFEIVQNYKVTLAFTSTTQIALSASAEYIGNYNLESLRIYLAVGSRIPYSVVQKIKPYLPNCDIISGYGMSETAGTITLGPINSEGSNGTLAPLLEAKVVNSSGETLGPHQPGEFHLRIPIKWQGYYKNPEATNATYDAERWIHTGDMGYFSESGDLYIIDRIKDICKYNHFHFFPTEIEQVICEIPDVSEVCVCGVSDIIAVHLPTAAIVKVPGSNLSEKEVYDYVAERMANYKQLRGGVYFVEKLPKTASGKTLRREVVKLCEKLREQTIKS